MKNPCAFLNQADAISALIPQTERLIELRETLSSLLPESLARHCSVANFKQGRVVVFASNGATAAKLKLMLPALLERLSGRVAEVTGMEVTVQAPVPPAQAVEKSATISSDAIAGLAGFCEQLPDSELKSTLARIVFQHRR
ncbi:MAG TPA: DUF721 domain-containing protein [Burkholderiales bacterium]|nr:DUF721 domain-containing protein [Burkholderiales bacterium]